MLNKRVIFSLIAASALAFSMNACSKDDKDSSDDKQTEQPDGPGTPGVVNEDGSDSFGVKACADDSACDTAKSSTKSLLAACDFQKAFEQADAIYLKQVADKKIDAETALTRGILGMIQIAYEPKIQALLPKLGFKSSTTDFKPLWKEGKAIEEIATAHHDYEDAYDLLPLKIVENDELDYLDTIDKDLTFEQILDAIVEYKPLIEDIALSFENAANAAQGSVKIQDAGCGLNQFEFDASDLNFFAATFHSVSLAIDLAAKYDFNFSLYKTITLSDDGYETQDYDFSSGSYVTDQQACTARKQFASMMDEHLFKKTQSTRTVKGTTARDEFTKVANLIKTSMSASNSGKFMDYSALKQGSKNDIIDIATKVASGSQVDLSKYIQPQLKIDLDKAFKDVSYREFQIKPVDCKYDEVLTENLMDFLYINYPKYVTGDELVLASVEKNECESGDYCWLEVDYDFKDSLDATFSTDWDYDNFWWDFFNVHEYFGSEENSNTVGPYQPEIEYRISYDMQNSPITISNDTKVITLSVKDTNDNPAIGSISCFILDSMPLMLVEEGTLTSYQTLELSSGSATITVKLKPMEYDSEQEAYIDSEGRLYSGESYADVMCQYDEHGAFGETTIQVDYDLTVE